MNDAEVEITGRLERPKDDKSQVHVFVTDGPCWAPSTRAFGHVVTGDPTFFVEVIVLQGTPLWLCAAEIPDKGPITVHGALPSAPLKGEGQGEVRYQNLSITLATGKPVERPAMRSAHPKTP